MSAFGRSLLLTAALALAASSSQAQEPSLPAGLETLAPLPTAPTDAAPPPAARRIPLPSLSGFWEWRAGFRVQHDPHEKSASIGETRIQLRLDQEGDRATATVVADGLADPVLAADDLDLETGDGPLDLRQANLLIRPFSWMDAKIGRQINTWGTGDLLFINDLFPKDWNIDGRRLSFWNAGLGRRSGRDAEVDAETPDRWFEDDEWAVRLYRTIGPYEAAAYGYDGFWKSPAGHDPATGRATFPRLQAFGASLRGPLGRGILSLEGGWYDSRDDRSGEDPAVRNSELRLLAGYEQELLRDLTGGIQYYAERMLDYGAYRRHRPAGTRTADRIRHVATLRLTRLWLSQNLRTGLFAFWSPSDQDGYLRPHVQYKLDDHWIVEMGGNLFAGDRDDTFFGQFSRNNNLYAAVRYGF